MKNIIIKIDDNTLLLNLSKGPVYVNKYTCGYYYIKNNLININDMSEEDILKMVQSDNDDRYYYYKDSEENAVIIKNDGEDNAFEVIYNNSSNIFNIAYAILENIKEEETFFVGCFNSKKEILELFSEDFI